MDAQIPVGVTWQDDRRLYHNLGLAQVEDYDPRAGFFLLHGPVGDDWSYEVADQAVSEADLIDTSESEGPASTLKRTLRFAIAREDQGGVRATLLDAYKSRCAVSGYDVPAALQAAHILNYRGRTSQSAANGLLLRADIHLLFDQHLLTVDPTPMRVLLAPSVRASRYAPLHNVSLSLPREHRLQPHGGALAIHFEASTRAWG
jgi:predicted restriction endonuclease